MNSKNILPFALAGVAGMSLQTAMAQERERRAAEYYPFPRGRHGMAGYFRAVLG